MCEIPVLMPCIYTRKIEFNFHIKRDCNQLTLALRLSGVIFVRKFFYKLLEVLRQVSLNLFSF